MKAPTDLSETLLNKGESELRNLMNEKVKNAKAELHWKYIPWILFLFGWIALIGLNPPEPKIVYKADVIGVKKYCDSLQHFVDTTLNYEPILKPKK